MHKSKVITARVEDEIYKWLKEQADKNHCSISELINDYILLAKQTAQDPEELCYSKQLQIRGVKSSIMAYRLMEKLTYELLKENGNNIIDSAYEISKKDFEKLEIEPE